MDMTIFERICLLFVETLSNLFTEHVNVGLVDVPALIDQRNSIVDLNVGKFFRFLLPILIQNEKKLLSSTC